MPRSRSNPLVVSSVLAAILAVSGCVSSSPDASPPALSSPPSADFRAVTDAWHADRVERLTAPDGWLSLVTLAWLESGPNRVGRDTEGRVVYEGLPADHVGTLHLGEDGVRFESAAGMHVSGLPEDGVLQTDADGSPTVLEIGAIRFHVIDRGGRLAVRMKDANAPTRTEFRGIERYPVGEAWRIVADFVPADEGSTVEADSVIGVVSELHVAGRARFVHDGHAVDLVLPAPSGAGHYVMFGDTTGGEGTYPGGRYLLVEPSTDGDTVILDFNRAYNPPCSFTPFATCSLPVPSNRLPFPVTAGERWKPAG